MTAVDHVALGRTLKAVRRGRHVSIRAAAAQMGVAFATVDRIERGHDCILSSAAAYCRWAQVSLDVFLDLPASDEGGA